jgi:hypothetical protein
VAAVPVTAVRPVGGVAAMAALTMAVVCATLRGRFPVPLCGRASVNAVFRLPECGRHVDS